MNEVFRVFQQVWTGIKQKICQNHFTAISFNKCMLQKRSVANYKQNISGLKGHCLSSDMTVNIALAIT